MLWSFKFAVCSLEDGNFHLQIKPHAVEALYASAGTHNPAVPKSKRLLSNNQSNILVSSAASAVDDDMGKHAVQFCPRVHLLFRSISQVMAEMDS